MSSKSECRHLNLVTPEFAQRYSAAWLLSRCCKPLDCRPLRNDSMRNVRCGKRFPQQAHGPSPNAIVKHCFDECRLGKFAGTPDAFRCSFAPIQRIL